MKKLNLHWDPINKWLYIGTKQGQNNQFALMIDNWRWISKSPTIRQWTLFEIMWDNGAWWSDLEETKEISIPHMNGKYIEADNFIKRSGFLKCFIQITVFGIGLRYWYDKNMTVYHK